MSAILDYLFLTIYMAGPWGVAFYVGLMWHAIVNKYDKNPQMVITVLFWIHYIIMIFILQKSFFGAILSNLVILAWIFVGNKFQSMGITGGIATGKSTVSQMLEASGFTIIDSDKISKEVSDDPDTLKQIRKKFWDDVFNFDDNPEGVLDRVKLGEIVFKNKNKRKALNNIMQGKIFWKLFTEFLRLKFREKKDMIVFDVPLLYETKIFEWISYPIIVVNVSDQDIVTKRLMSRNKLTEEQAVDRIKSQMPLKLKCEKADIIVNNDGNFNDLQNEFAKRTLKHIYNSMKPYDASPMQPEQ